jgi:predicted short-subunit dehydrogenase-like oxidoreductase (DUF2520 family)
MTTRAGTRKPTAPSMPSVAVIGPGNWGSSLINALHKARVPVNEIVLPRPSRRPSRGLRFTPFNRARLDASILWLCVPDSSIAEVTSRMVHRLAKRPSQMTGQIVVHSSGALNVGVLDAAAGAGASVASVHPVMTFPTRNPVSLTGVPFGIEADASARRTLNRIVRRLGGKPFALSSSSKALYHAVGMFASPLFVSLLAAAEQIAGLAGMSPAQARSVIAPIVRASLENVFRQGAANSFSGPIARGDLVAIQLHLTNLSAHPILADVYRALSLYALEALPSRNAEGIHRLLARVPAGMSKPNDSERARRVPRSPAP